MKRFMRKVNWVTVAFVGSLFFATSLIVAVMVGNPTLSVGLDIAGFVLCLPWMCTEIFKRPAKQVKLEQIDVQGPPQPSNKKSTPVRKF